MKLSYHILLRVAILKFQQRIFITVNVWRQAFIFLLSALHSQTRFFGGRPNLKKEVDNSSMCLYNSKKLGHELLGG